MAAPHPLSQLPAGYGTLSILRTYFHDLCPKITFFLNISNLSKSYLIDFFYSVPNFGPGMVQLRYQRAK